MPEQWRPVVGYEGFYSVSDRGNVRSESRVVTDSLGRLQPLRSQPIRPQKHGNTKYFHVTLRQDGKAETWLIHQLVLAAFVGPCPVGMESLHWDDVGSNNSLSNLRYGTRSTNSHDKVRNGNDHNASKTHCKRGHEFTPENTYRYGTGRHCRTCVLARAKAHKQARRRAA